jgi:hypothetical protein
MSELKYCPFCGKELPHQVDSQPELPKVEKIWTPLEPSGPPIVSLYAVSPYPPGTWIKTTISSSEDDKDAKK